MLVFMAGNKGDSGRLKNEALVRFRKSKGWVQKELADALGVSRGYIATLEAGAQEVSKEIESRLKELGFREDDIADDAAPISPMFGKLVEVPVYGKVAAGEGEYNVDAHEDRIYVPYPLSQINSFVMRIEGDSMRPYLHEGDAVLFRPMSRPRDNRTFMFKTEDDKVRIKLLIWKDNAWYMRSTNPRYADEHLGKNQIIGLLVGIYRSEDGLEKMASNLHGLDLKDI